MAFITALVALALVIQLPGCQPKGEMPRNKYPAGWPIAELPIPAGSTDIVLVNIPGGETNITFTGSMRIEEAFELIRERLAEAGWSSMEMGEKIEPPARGMHYISSNQQSRVKIYAEPVVSPIAWSEGEARKHKYEIKYRYAVFRR